VIGLTGLLSEEGKVEAVSEDSISYKVEAAFFSWLSYLVVPGNQKNSFEKHVKKLNRQYPNRQLKIIGLANFEDFIHDRRIVRYKRESRTKYYLKKAWQRKFSLTTIFTIGVLLMIVGHLWYGPIDKNPVIGKFEGSRLKIFNKSGQLLKIFDAGFRSEHQAGGNRTGGRRPQVQFQDIDGDGINEIFWAKSSGKQVINQIQAWSLSGDSLIWERPLIFDINFPRKNSIVNNEYNLEEFHIEKISKDSVLLVGNAELSALFPDVIFTADAKTGKVIQKYIHPGYLYDLIMKDLNGDGVKEVLATGMNNAYWKAAITVLSITNLQGHAPTKGDYIVSNFKPADELSYLLIPKTVLGHYFDPVEKSNFGRKILIRNNEKLIYFSIVEAKPPRFPNAKPPYLLAYFNTDMQPVGFGTSNEYDIMVRDLYQEGKIPTMPDYDYFESFKDSLLYWDGQEFVHQPVSVYEK